MAQKNESYPTYANAQQLKPLRRDYRWLIVFGAIVGGIAALIGIMYGVAKCAVGNQTTPGPTVTCDEAGPAARQKWLVTPGGDRTTPHDRGFRIEGACDLKLVSRGLECDRASVYQVEHDDPYMVEAKRFGFTTFVCDGPKGRVEYAIADLLK